MKYWGISYQQAMWDISYQNLMLLTMSIPKYDKEGNEIEAPAELSGKDLMSRLTKKRE